MLHGPIRRASRPRALGIAQPALMSWVSNLQPKDLTPAFIYPSMSRCASASLIPPLRLYATRERRMMA